MKLSHFAMLALVSATTLAATQAVALSEDDKSMNTPSGAPRFSDPDDNTPSAVNLQGSGKSGSGNVDPSSVRYDYDPSSGSYVPHKN